MADTDSATTTPSTTDHQQQQAAPVSKGGFVDTRSIAPTLPVCALCNGENDNALYDVGCECEQRVLHVRCVDHVTVEARLGHTPEHLYFRCAKCTKTATLPRKKIALFADDRLILYATLIGFMFVVATFNIALSNTILWKSSYAFATLLFELIGLWGVTLLDLLIGGSNRAAIYHMAGPWCSAALHSDMAHLHVGYFVTQMHLVYIGFTWLALDNGLIAHMKHAQGISTKLIQVVAQATVRSVRCHVAALLAALLLYLWMPLEVLIGGGGVDDGSAEDGQGRCAFITTTYELRGIGVPSLGLWTVAFCLWAWINYGLSHLAKWALLEHACIVHRQYPISVIQLFFEGLITELAQRVKRTPVVVAPSAEPEHPHDE